MHSTESNTVSNSGKFTKPRAARTDRLRAAGTLTALAITAFTYVTTENLPVGLIGLITRDFGTSLATTGLLVAGYGLTVALVSLPLARLTRDVPRRWLLVAMIGIFVIATWVAAATSHFVVLAAARVVTAGTQAVFWSVMPAVAAGLFPAEARGRAMAAVFAGGSSGPLLGVPAAIWLGQQTSWRISFLAVSGLGLVALTAVAVLVPTEPPGRSSAATGHRPDARRFAVLVVTTATAVAGVFAAYTYTVPFFTQVAGVSAGSVSVLVMARGVAGFSGLVTGTSLIDRRPKAVINCAIALATVSLFGMYAFGTARPVAVGLLMLSGFAMGALPSAFQHRVLEVAPGSSDLASAGNGAAFNLGIAGGAALGGTVLRSAGVHSTVLVGGVLTAVALAVFLSERLVASPLVPGGTSRPTRGSRSSRTVSSSSGAPLAHACGEHAAG